MSESSATERPELDQAARGEGEATPSAPSPATTNPDAPVPAAPEPTPPAPATPAPSAAPASTPPAPDDIEWLDSELPPDSEPTWYGWQTLATDAGALLAIAGAVALGRAEDACSGRGGRCDHYETGAIALVGLAGATYLFGAPSVHFGHDQTGKGLGSLAMRLTAPLLVVVGFANCSILGSCPGAPLILAGFVAVPIAIAVDAAWLAYDEPDAIDAGRLLLTPAYDPATRRVGLGLTTRF